MLLTQDRSLFWEAPCEGAGVQRNRQKLNNLISTPLFTSPPLSSLSHLLSFPHVCLLTISPLVCSPLFSSNLFAHLFPLSPSFVLMPHLLSFPRSRILSHPPASPTPLVPHPSSPFLYIPLPFLLFLICRGSPISRSAHVTKNMNNFKHSDRKHWNTYCSTDKDTQLKLITSFFKQKTGDFAAFNSTFVEQLSNCVCVCKRACVCDVGRWDGAW